MADRHLKIEMGLKLGSFDRQYSHDIFSLYDNGFFSYIELFAITASYAETIDYWRQFDIPFVIHAPHSAAGMNLADPAMAGANCLKIEETLRFADALSARSIIFHSGIGGRIEEAVRQLHPYVDSRFVLENKPRMGLDGSVCVGCSYEELSFALDSLSCGFCLDFGHAICAANSLGEDPFSFIGRLQGLSPVLFHLTDGEYAGELDRHKHYGEGDFPLARLCALLPDQAMVTNESMKNSTSNLDDFRADVVYLSQIL